MGHHSCCNQQKVKRGLWSPEEDEKLIRYISARGYGCWSEVPEKAGLQRCGKSCRLRWINYLRPDIRRGRFSPEEEKLIISLHEMVGNRWAHIASHLPGRTDNEIKNYWNSWIKKKIRKPSTPQSSTSPPELSTTISAPSYNNQTVNQFDSFAAQTLMSSSHQETMFPSHCPIFMFETSTAEVQAVQQDVWNTTGHNELFSYTSGGGGGMGSSYLPPLVDGVASLEPTAGDDRDPSGSECFEKQQELNDWVESQQYPCLFMWENVQEQLGGGGGGDELSIAPNNMETIVSSFSSS